MQHYTAFADCPSMADLRVTLDQTRRREIAHGIHLIAAQEADGSVTIGDSHHYGDSAPPERLEEVDRLMMDEAQRLLSLPDARIADWGITRICRGRRHW